MNRAAFFVACLLPALVAAGQPKPPPPKAPKPPEAQPEQPAKPTIRVSNALGFVIQKGAEQGHLTLADADRGWAIRDGEAKLSPNDFKRSIDPKLQITRFAAADGTVVVQVDATPGKRDEYFNKAIEAADKSKPLLLIDTKGRKYEPVGFIYRDPRLVHIRFTKGDALKSFNQAPSVTRNNPDRELMLLFCVNLGMEIKELRIGDKVIETYNPPIKCDQKQK